MLENFELLSCAPGCVYAGTLAFFPSIAWLYFFWIQDSHPEPKRIMLRIFIWGILAALPIVAIESVIFKFFSPLFAPNTLIYGLIGIALIEEVGKYAVVYFKALPLREFNEPQDAMIYMITAALGFAAIENVAYALSVYEGGLASSLYLTLGRFLTANLLHVIASGFVGYAIARSIFTRKKKTRGEYTGERKRGFVKYAVVGGLGIAIVLHGLYNHFIIQEATLQIISLPIVSLAILIGGSVAVIFVFRHMRSWPPAVRSEDGNEN